MSALHPVCVSVQGRGQGAERKRHFRGGCQLRGALFRWLLFWNKLTNSFFSLFHSGQVFARCAFLLFLLLFFFLLPFVALVARVACFILAIRTLLFV